jgi:hypothetical protein
VFILTLFAQTTLCYKENIKQATKNYNLTLDGEECKGKLSPSKMKQNGWEIDYFQALKSGILFNHLYIFKKKTINPNSIITKNEKMKIKIEKQRLALDLSQKKIQLTNVTKKQAILNYGNLKIGQSGIIIHNYGNNTLIVGEAIVISSGQNNSTLKIISSDVLKQNTIPTSRRKPENGDIFILNHMYNSSLIIVPNFETYQEVKALYPKQNFINPDIFAAYLKIKSTPVPKPKDLYKFCKDNDLGTIFISVNNELYILDTNSFKILNKTLLLTTNHDIQTPFFTKVSGIKQHFWSFGDKRIYNYNNYYLAVVNNQSIITNIKDSNDDQNNNKDKDPIDYIKSGFSKLIDMLPSW